LLLGVALLLSHDAGSSARFHEPAPLLAFVIDEQGEAQIGLEGITEEPDNNEQSNEDYSNEEYFPSDEDDALTAAHEAETSMLEEERERAVLSS
jgi:hypothetical protein